MSRLKAVVFDADGTLFNSFELIVAAYHHVAQVHGLRSPTAQEVRDQLGKSIPDIVRALFPDNSNISELVNTNSSYYGEHVASTDAFAGVEDILKHLHQAGLKLALLTGAGSSITSLLRHHKIENYFSGVVTHERVTHFKPDPEGFVLATKDCGVNSAEAIMVGDMVPDILVGKNGQALATIAVTHGYGTVDNPTKAGADYIVNDLAAAEKVILNLLRGPLKPVRGAGSRNMRSGQ
jgi:phosphoglycolate phosphatase